MRVSDDVMPPARPAIPPTLWALVAVVICEQAVLRCGMGFMAMAPITAGCAVCVAVFAARKAISGKRETARFCLLIAAAAIAGSTVSSMAVDTGRAAVTSLSETSISTWSFAVIGDARESNGLYRVRARAQHEGNPSTDVWLFCSERFYPGMTVRGVGRLKLPGDTAWDIASRAQGINASVALVKVSSIEQRGGPLGALDALRRRFSDLLDPSAGPSRAFMAACAVGDRSGFDALDMEDVLRRCGVSHLVAVSGTHLALVAASFAAALETTPARMRLRALILVAATGVFVLLCGAPASAVRAWLMSVSLAASSFVERRNHGLSALSLSALAMALIDSTVTGQVAYQLSVAAVLGIYIVNPYVRYVLEVLFDHRPLKRQRRLSRSLSSAERYARDLLAMSLTAQIVTLPITASTFSEISLISPLSNLIASIPIAVLTIVGLAACVLSAIPILSRLVIQLAEPIGDVLMAVLGAIAGLPHAAIAVPAHASAVGILLLGAVLILVWFSPKLSRRAIAVPIAVAAIILTVRFGYQRYFAPARMVVLDVGQGDAILIQEGPNAVLVDAGPAGSLSDALARNGIYHLDAVILSHLHNDHYGGVADLAGAVPCDAVMVAQGSAGYFPPELSDAVATLGISSVSEVSCGDEVRFGHFTLTVIAPMGLVDGLENEDSMFLLVEYDDGRRVLTALLTGDGESAELASVITSSGVSDIDILKVGHHGSEGSITAEQAAVLSSRYAIASAGKDNEFGHPNSETVRILEDSGAVFLCTKDCGDIAIRPSVRSP